jgi:hypothetical protein
MTLEERSLAVKPSLPLIQYIDLSGNPTPPQRTNLVEQLEGIIEKFRDH